MTSKSSTHLGPARCQHKSSAPCSSCRYEHEQTKDAGAWTYDSPGTQPARRIPEDYVSFSREKALRTSTKDTTQPQTQSKKPTQQPTSSDNKSSNSQRPYRHHPSLTSSNLKRPQQATTATSSAAATRANSPVTHRTIAPVYDPRQALPASANAAVIARGYSRASTPQTENQLSARMARTTIAPVCELEDSEEESGASSGDSSNEDDDK